jgi:hypothetical protein
MFKMKAFRLINLVLAISLALALIPAGPAQAKSNQISLHATWENFSRQMTFTLQSKPSSQY